MNAGAYAQDLLANGWFVFVAFSLLLYLLLDGFDLGVGIFALGSRDEQERAHLMAAIGPFWDANETWLIVAGGTLFAAFPAVYGTLLNYLMVPLALLLIAVILRGVSFEFHHFSPSHLKPIWGYSFSLGSLLMAFALGLMGGGFLQGFPLSAAGSGFDSQVYAGSAWTFLTPFSVACGVGVSLGAALLGVSYLPVRLNDGPVRRRAYRVRRWLLPLTGLYFAGMMAFSLQALPWLQRVWIGGRSPAFAVLAVACAGVIWKAWRQGRARRPLAAFVWTELLVVLAFIGLLLSLFPQFVPHTWSIRAGAAPLSTLSMISVAFGVLLPMLVIANYYQLWIFRGRLSRDATYASAP